MTTSTPCTEAFVTLATSDCYATGALVLAASLRKVHTTRHLAIMVTEGVSYGMKRALHKAFDLVEMVDVFDSKDNVNLELLSRPELGVTFTKLHCWRLTQYTKAVFMDADTLVLENIDELFEREELSATRDPGWPDCFNSGVFVFIPNDITYKNLMHFAVTTGSYDGGDQGLLNSYFANWGFADINKHLPYLYNCCSITFYSYLPALKQFASKVKVVHFIGMDKPWCESVPSDTSSRGHQISGSSLPDFRQMWWNVFMEHVETELRAVHLNLHAGGHVTVCASGAGDHAVCEPSEEVSDHGHGDMSSDRQQEWESGRADYMGADRFDNIMTKISSSIGSSMETAASLPDTVAPAASSIKKTPAAAKKK